MKKRYDNKTAATDFANILKKETIMKISKSVTDKFVRSYTSAAGNTYFLPLPVCLNKNIAVPIIKLLKWWY